ncbi:hypothetical protein [Mammaliicoccus sciuri]|uniref:hypothetical protein n=1 Tax=Mammaliicoccus sciuri TaxID=1296 RepID=UPI0021CFAA2C|nr:hypothetical protein [Mammaliicoccus sciuri]UXU70261.1 hypothetical protein MUA36_06135 [Mammaliicoccus sciuri]
MSKSIQAELEEQLLKALGNIENMVFSTDDYDIKDITFQVTPYVDEVNELDITLNVELIPTKRELNND